MAVGRRLGNYDIERELGRGGMGAVYIGKHQLLGRAAAVKILQAHYSKDQDVVKRFFNEARAATAIKHPSIVEIFDFGFADDGSAYIVMELCDGESLGARIKRMRVLPVPTALAITRQIAGALAAAHKAGIIHRDLKPDNVFLVPDPEVVGGERIKLLDFGIAKLAGESSGPSATQTGAILGTPYYMSPEQCRGAGHVDQRADLYSLGCILFEMVCGRVPFVGEGAGEIIGAHLHVAPPKPTAMVGSVPADVEALILSLLAKKADERPARADLVVSAIHAIAGTTPAPTPASDTFGLMATAAGSEPGKKSSPVVSGYGDTLDSGQQLAVPSAIGSSPGVGSTHPSPPPSGLDSTQPSTFPPVADTTPDAPPTTPKRITARMTVPHVPVMPRGQKIVALALVLAALVAAAGAFALWPRMPKRVAHRGRVAEVATKDLSQAEVQLEVVPAKPGDPPTVRATVIGVPHAYLDEPEAFALVDVNDKVPTAMPVLSTTSLAESDESDFLVVLVQGSENFVGFGGLDRGGVTGADRSFSVLNALNQTFSHLDVSHLPKQTQIQFMQYSSDVSTVDDPHEIGDIGPLPLGAKGKYIGKAGNELAEGAAQAIGKLERTASARKALIIIGDGNDTDDDYTKQKLNVLRKRAATSGIQVFAIIYKTPGAGDGSVVNQLALRSTQTISSLDMLAPTLMTIMSRLDDRYWLTFPTYDVKGHFGLSLDGRAHDLAVRFGDQAFEPVTLSLPRWSPPRRKPTLSWILGGASLALLLLAAATLLRDRRQRQLLAIPRA